MKKGLSALSLVITLVAVSLDSTGCASKTDARDANLNGQQVVYAYYQTLAKGDTATAQTYLTDDYAKAQAQAPDSELNNIGKISDVNVGSEVPLIIRNRDYQEEKVDVTYTAIFKKETAKLHNGDQDLVVYVSKKARTSPWRILTVVPNN